MLSPMTPEHLLVLGPALHALTIEACRYAGVDPRELQVFGTAVMDNGNVVPFVLTPPAPERALEFVVEEL